MSVCGFCRELLHLWDLNYVLSCGDKFHFECILDCFELEDLSECPRCYEPLSDWDRELLHSFVRSAE